MFKQDKLQFTTKHYILLSVCVCVCVCVCEFVCCKLLAATAMVAVVVAAGAAGGGGGREVIQAGLVLQHVYIPGENHTN